MSKRLKVFGIGLNKTGTTSLKQALKTLGYRHFTHSTPLTRAWARQDWAAIEAVADAHESFEDWPWPLVWQRMEARFGDGARFILTRRRTPEVWLDSLKRHAERGRPGGMVRNLVYGHDYPHGHEAEHLSFYREHAARVRAHFADPARSHRFIELCWEEGDGWPDLCAFLGEACPAEAFPHANASDSSTADPEKIAENQRRIASRMARLRSSPA